MCLITSLGDADALGHGVTEHTENCVEAAWYRFCWAPTCGVVNLRSDVWNTEISIAMARRVVAGIDQRELVLFDVVAADSSLMESGVEDRADGSLGFGVDLASLSHITLSVIEATGPMLLSVLGGAATGAATEVIKEPLVERLKKLLNHDSDRANPFPDDVVDRARDVVRDRAIELGVDASQADNIAAVVRSVLNGTA